MASKTVDEQGRIKIHGLWRRKIKQTSARALYSVEDDEGVIIGYEVIKYRPCEPGNGSGAYLCGNEGFGIRGKSTNTLEYAQKLLEEGW